MSQCAHMHAGERCYRLAVAHGFCDEHVSVVAPTDVTDIDEPCKRVDLAGCDTGLTEAVRSALATRDATIAELRAEVARLENCSDRLLSTIEKAGAAEDDLRAELKAWREAVPKCAHIRDLHTNPRSCDRPATKGPQDSDGDDYFGDLWCDEHAPTDRDIEDCNWLEDLPWADLLRSAAEREGG